MNDAMDDLDLYEDERKAADEEKELDRSDEAVTERATKQDAPQAYRTTFTGEI